MDERGQITSIHGQGMTIYHGAEGGRTIVAQREDHARLVTWGTGRGFVERPIMRGERPYIERTYVAGGRSWARVYRGGYYHGLLFYRYVPPVVFAPGFYSWAYRPWRTRVFFSWGWGPWFGAYGYYFWPYPYYLDASMWLTDYAISQQLQDAYDSGYYAGSYAPAAGTYAALTPELKQAIADEVKTQLAQQANAQGVAANADVVPDALNPNIRTFVVSTALTEQLPTGAECSLSPGDVLTRIDDTPTSDQQVRVMVSSSQANDCPSGSQLMMKVQDLQDMQNTFHERIQDGLDELSNTQGKNGIPSGPAANPTPLAEGNAQPDPDAAAELQQERDSAKQVEQDVRDAVPVPLD